MVCVRREMVVVLVCLNFLTQVTADTNFLTGANDIVVVPNQNGDLEATNFGVQFGKKDIWLPRAGHTVSIKVNGAVVPVSMILDGAGQGYFSTEETGNQRYRFWSALLGSSDPLPHQRTDTPTTQQLNLLNLKQGMNLLEYEVETAAGSIVSTEATVFLINSTQKIVVTDIDGTITRSNIRGFILPALGISDWKHDGIVELYSKIEDEGYMFLYLTSRAVGQSESTKQYINSLREGRYRMPSGPLMMQLNSVVDTLKTEVIDQDPEVQKIAKLSRLQALFPTSPLYAGYGNQDSDIRAYTALNIDLNRIFVMDKASNIRNLGSGTVQNFTQHIESIQDIYPNLN